MALDEATVHEVIVDFERLAREAIPGWVDVSSARWHTGRTSDDYWNWRDQRFDRAYPLCVRVNARTWLSSWPFGSESALDVAWTQMAFHRDWARDLAIGHTWKAWSEATDDSPSAENHQAMRIANEFHDSIKTVTWLTGRMRYWRRRSRSP